MHNINCLIKEDLSYVWEPPNLDLVLNEEMNVSVIEELRQELLNVEFNMEAIRNYFEQFSKEHSIPLPKILRFLRNGVTGLKVTKFSYL